MKLTKTQATQSPHNPACFQHRARFGVYTALGCLLSVSPTVNYISVFCYFFRHMAETPSRLSLPGVCVGVCRLLGHHATRRLGKLCSRTLWDILHIGLVAGPGLRVRPELCHGHPVLLSHPPNRHHCLLLCYDHLQGQVVC